MNPMIHLLLFINLPYSTHAFAPQKKQFLHSLLPFSSSYTNPTSLFVPSTTTTSIGVSSSSSSSSSKSDIETKDILHTDNNDPLKFDLNIHLPESEYTQVVHTESLVPIATLLRQRYDDLFHDPRQPNANRFIWDPWFVNYNDGKFGQPQQQQQQESDNDNDTVKKNAEQLPGEAESIGNQIQYSLKRIQSSTLFGGEEEQASSSSSLYEMLIDDLTSVGRSIGLKAITPPWVSLYTNGDRQNFHTDAPHGPMAFVLSLCQQGDFEGGETILLKKNILEYWRGFDSSVGLECGDILRYIPPTPLGRCIAFDPRVPHGVNTMIGTNDPRKGRVVIHGWFNDPEVCWFGPWNGEVDDDSFNNDIVPPPEINQYLEEALQPIINTLGDGEIGRVMGYLAIRMEIDEGGSVDDITAVCDTLQADWDDFRGIIGYDEAERPVMEDAVSDVRLTIFENCKALNFGEGKEGRALVVPFVFE